MRRAEDVHDDAVAVAAAIAAAGGRVVHRALDRAEFVLDRVERGRLVRGPDRPRARALERMRGLERARFGEERGVRGLRAGEEDGTGRDGVEVRGERVAMEGRIDRSMVGARDRKPNNDDDDDAPDRTFGSGDASLRSKDTPRYIARRAMAQARTKPSDLRAREDAMPAVARVVLPSSSDDAKDEVGLTVAVFGRDRGKSFRRRGFSHFLSRAATPRLARRSCQPDVRANRSSSGARRTGSAARSSPTSSARSCRRS
jgi:hypothetical protein